MSHAVPQLQEGIRKALDNQVELDVEIAGFVEGLDAHTASQRLHDLENSALHAYEYAVRQAGEKLKIGDRLRALHIQHAPSEKRVLFSAGPDVIYRCDVARSDNYRDEGYYSVDELERILPGVFAGLEERIDPRAPAMPPPPPRSRDEYLKTIAKRFSSRIDAAVGRSIKLDYDWSGIIDTPAYAELLAQWGLNRVAGAILLLSASDQIKDDLAESFRSVRISFVDSPDKKSCTYSDGRLALALCLAAGDRGCFYEHQIAEVITQAMGTETRPIIADLRKEAQEWESRLRELLRRRLTFEVDYPGFTSHPDQGKNLFALNLLREHGIDHLYYAVSGLCEKNPNFKQQLAARVETLRLLHVPSADQKGLSSDGSTIVYRLFLHEGYQGYLTIGDMEKLLPAIVAKMKNLKTPLEPERDPRDGTTAPTQQEEKAALKELQELAKAQQRQNDANYREAVTQLQRMLPIYEAQFVAGLGRPLKMEIDWDSLGGDPENVVNLINHCLAPAMGAISIVAADATYRPLIAQYIFRVRLGKAKRVEKQAFDLAAKCLTITSVLTPEATPIDINMAATLLKTLIDRNRVTPSKKAAPKRAKPAAKRPKPSKNKPKRARK